MREPARRASHEVTGDMEKNVRFRLKPRSLSSHVEDLIPRRPGRRGPEERNASFPGFAGRAARLSEWWLCLVSLVKTSPQPLLLACGC